MRWFDFFLFFIFYFHLFISNIKLKGPKQMNMPELHYYLVTLAAEPITSSSWL